MRHARDVGFRGFLGPTSIAAVVGQNDRHQGGDKCHRDDDFEPDHRRKSEDTKRRKEQECGDRFHRSEGRPTG